MEDFDTTITGLPLSNSIKGSSWHGYYCIVKISNRPHH